MRFARSAVGAGPACLTQMNVQLQHVISDLTGVTGRAILEAILAGERDAPKLAALKDHRIKASRDTIAKSLRGDWREEHLFTLRQSHALWSTYQELIADCDAQIQAMLQEFDARVDLESAPLGEAKTSHKKPQKNQPAFDARTECYRVLGVDLTALPGVETPTALVLLCELGPGFAEKFATAKHFASWLGPVPGQPHHRRQNPLQQNARGAEPRGHRAAPGRPEPVARAKLLWRSVSPVEGAPGEPESRDGDGAQTGARALAPAQVQAGL